MPQEEMLKGLCFDEKGELKSKSECRASMINHLILEEMMDIDDAEDLAEKTLKELDLWPLPPQESAPEEDTPETTP